MAKDYGVIDVWMQHPTPRFLNQPIFDSLRKWGTAQGKVTADIPVEFTLGAMDEAGVQLGLICAWWGPQGPTISSDEEAAAAACYSSICLRRKQ